MKSFKICKWPIKQIVYILRTIKNGDIFANKLSLSKSVSTRQGVPPLKWFKLFLVVVITLEQGALENVNYYLNTNIYSYLETSCGQSSNLYLSVVHCFKTSVN